MFLALVFLITAQVIDLRAGPTEFFSPAMAGQETTPRPDVKSFTPVLSKELEFRINDYQTGFLGRVIVYQNPNDPNEFVRVYYRQVAIVSKRDKENNTAESDGFDRNLSNLKYHQRREAETLGRVQQAVDAFAYVQWRTVRDPRTGQDIRTGPMLFWLLDPNGTYAGYSQSEGVEENALKYSPFSEPSKVNPGSPITVGLKFVLGDTEHIVRIDQDDALTPVKEKKQKEASNDK